MILFSRLDAYNVLCWKKSGRIWIHSAFIVRTLQNQIYSWRKKKIVWVSDDRQFMSIAVIVHISIVRQKHFQLPQIFFYYDDDIYWNEKNAVEENKKM